MNVRLVGWFTSYKKALDAAHLCRTVLDNSKNRYKVHYCVIEYSGDN